MPLQVALALASVLLSAAMLTPDPAAAGPAQVAGLDGCTTAAGVRVGQCQQAVGVDPGMLDVTTSEDGRNAYMLELEGGAISAFSRDHDTGHLDQLAGTDACIDDGSRPGTCVTAPLPAGITSLTLDAAGTSLYAPAPASHAMAIFDRDPADGALSWRSCIADVTSPAAGCSSVRGIATLSEVNVTPDSEHLYAIGDDIVAVLERDPDTGIITQDPGTAGCLSTDGLDSTGAPTCTIVPEVVGITSMTFAPNGAFAFSVHPDGSRVQGWNSSQADGTLIPVSGAAGCLASATSPGSCTAITGISQPASIVIDPASDSLYVGSTSGALATVHRSDMSGEMAQQPGECIGAGCASPTLCQGLVCDSSGTFLDGAGDLTIAGDGAYVLTVTDHGVAAFDRDPVSGAFTGVGTCYSPDLHPGCVALIAGNGAASIAAPAGTANVYIAAAEPTGGVETLTSQLAAAPGAPSTATPITAPTLTGTAREGATLTHVPGTWSTTVTTDVTWQICRGSVCNEIPGASSTTYTLTAADVGGQVRVVETVDGIASPSASSVTVTALVPRNVSAPAIAGTARHGSTLTADAGAWSSATATTTMIRWHRCSSAGTTCTATAIGTGTTYVPTLLDVGYLIEVRVTVTNGAGSTTASSSRTAPTLNMAPRSTIAPSISGAMLEGSLIAARVGSWASASALTYTFSWMRCDASGAACAAIPGATTSTLRLVSADAGIRVKVAVTAHAGGSQTTAISAASTTVAVPAPRLRALSRTTLLPTAVAMWDPPANGLSTRYDIEHSSTPANGAQGAWIGAGTDVSATTSSAAIAAGDSLCVRVRSHDAAGNLSAWTPQTCTTRPIDDADLIAAGSWTHVADAAAYGGGLTTSTSTSAILTTLPVTTRSIRVMAATCPTCGSVRVRFNGVAVATVSLYAPVPRTGQVLGTFAFASARTGVITLEPTIAGRTTSIDGLALSPW